MKRKFILFIICACNLTIHAQTTCLSAYEASLLKQINELRLSKKLPAVALSKSLTIVAQTHVNDLSVNNPVTKRCNLHSWSNKGRWTSCCYTEDHKKAECMWNKPRELTNYKGNGYEIAFSTTNSSLSPVDFAKEAVESWINSPGHISVILNKGIWKDIKWNAIGIGVANGYAVVWFGEKEDEEAKPLECK